MNAATACPVISMSLLARLRAFFLSRRPQPWLFDEYTHCQQALPPPPPPTSHDRERERRILRESRRLRQSAAALDDLLQESTFDAWLAERDG